MIGHYYPTLKDRVIYLCSRKGIDTSPEKLPRILAKAFMNSDLIPCLPENREKTLDNVRKKIERDLKQDTAAYIPGDHIDLYCRYFGCSADFLMGYIDTSTHEEKSVQDLTGLSDTSCSALIYKHTDVIAALNDLLSGIEDSDNEKKVDSISSIKRRLLRRIHRYFHPEKINDPNAFLELRHFDSDIFMTSYLKGFAPESISAVQMLGIQEELQRIRDDIQNKNKAPA